ncbi:acyltransferase family protein [Ectopseudomonas chengduensis]
MNASINNGARLDQLTALRFFAALMIVFHHSIGLFGLKSLGVNLGQGVSFFFILSGFILAYVYPSLGSWREIRKFWWARIARIWPAHLACLFLGFLLIPYSFEIKTFLANVFLVQAWLPLSKYYFSYNAVSWSISSELFFYLAFPFLLSGWFKRVWVKFLVALLLLVLIIVISNSLNLPSYGRPGVGMEGVLVSEHGLVYISPLSRIFEFVCGVCIAAIYKRRSPSTVYWLATAYEVGAILLCALAVFNMNYLIRLSHDLMLGTSMAMWLHHCGSFLAFGMLIYVVAHGRGLISKILATPGLVFLGEISFSIYLIHQIFLIKYRQNTQMLSHLSDVSAFAIYMMTVLLAAYLIWFFVEMPGRRLMLGLLNGYGGAARKPWQLSNSVSKGKPLFAVLGLVCTFSFLNFTAAKATQDAASKLTPISLAEAESMTSASMKSYLGINFQNAFTV